MLVDILFYVFATLLVAGALGVITARNPVYSALFLVFSFINSAAIWLLVEAEFLALVLVLVYVGAVMVLFLFVVMMLDIDITKLREGWVRFLPAGLLVAVVMLLQILALIGIKAKMAVPFPDNAASAAAEVSNTAWLARSLFTEFLLPFEFAAVILTVAVIAAVMLTLRKREGIKSQNPAEQSRVKAGDRLRIVKVAVEKPQRDNPPAIDAGSDAAEGESKP